MMQSTLHPVFDFRQSFGFDFDYEKTVICSTSFLIS